MYVKERLSTVAGIGGRSLNIQADVVTFVRRRFWQFLSILKWVYTLDPVSSIVRDVKPRFR